VTANVFVTPAELLNPASITSVAPGQVVGLNAADPDSTPSFADACLSGTLQYQFCISADPDGGGGGQPDDDCNDLNPNDAFADDVILRGWTENPSIAVAPQASGHYVTEVRCSTDTSCIDAHGVDVDVLCPDSANGLPLYDVRAERNGGTYLLRWEGPAVAVDTWRSIPLTSSSQLDGTTGPCAIDPSVDPVSEAYPGSCQNNQVITQRNITADAVAPGQFRGYLFKLQGDILWKGIPGFYCNAKTWRSGGAYEVDFQSIPTEGASPVGRDSKLGNP
jgi:hypothetical protein